MTALLAQLAGWWRGLRRSGPDQAQFWLIALLVGIAAGYATILFRLAIQYLELLTYGATDATLASHAAKLPWWRVVLVPILGGLAVGLILQRFTPDARIRSVSHVIEGAALRNGRVERRAGKASILASLITLSTGGSTGREGPVVHMGALIATRVSDFLKVDGVTARDLMGCAVAAAVAASFNAPLAGAIFALEVVLRHHNVHAFAPIAIASVAGAVIGRLHFGNVVEFSFAAETLAFYIELPAFMLLGIVSGLLATLMMRAIFWTEDVANRVQERLGLPDWLRPGVAGLLLGLVALEFPHVIGVGYETTSSALAGGFGFREAVLFAAAKVLAVAITIGGRMGGGVFSPAMMFGAMIGLAFGVLATGFFPQFSSSLSVYAMAGMAAVAASVLGAPISTTLIAIEMTGNWQVGIAVMVAVSLSAFVSDRLVHRSFFLTQLERRGLHVASGPQAYLLATISVEGLVRREAGPPSEAMSKLIEEGSSVPLAATLETAFPRLEQANSDVLPVLDGKRDFVGTLHLKDALRAYANALAANAREEHA